MPWRTARSEHAELMIPVPPINKTSIDRYDAYWGLGGSANAHYVGGMVRGFGRHNPQLHSSVFVAHTASVLGDVEMAEDSSVWFGAVLRGDMGKIKVGERTNIQDNATVHMTHDVSDAVLGADVIVGHNAVIHGAIVEDEVLIGMGCVVMDNAHVGKGAWVAAGTLVPPRTIIPPGVLYMNGAVKRNVRPAERQWLLDAVKRYVELARLHNQEIR
jgi:gamma-carbonic anhydrase